MLTSPPDTQGQLDPNALRREGIHSEVEEKGAPPHTQINLRYPKKYASLGRGRLPSEGLRYWAGVVH